MNYFGSIFRRTLNFSETNRPDACMVPANTHAGGADGPQCGRSMPIEKIDGARQDGRRHLSDGYDIHDHTREHISCSPLANDCSTVRARYHLLPSQLRSDFKTPSILGSVVSLQLATCHLATTADSALLCRTTQVQVSAYVRRHSCKPAREWGCDVVVGPT